MGLYFDGALVLMWTTISICPRGWALISMGPLFRCGQLLFQYAPDDGHLFQWDPYFDVGHYHFNMPQMVGPYFGGTLISTLATIISICPRGWALISMGPLF